jgi:diacylglycerol kinase
LVARIGPVDNNKLTLRDVAEAVLTISERVGAVTLVRLSFASAQALVCLPGAKWGEKVRKAKDLGTSHAVFVSMFINGVVCKLSLGPDAIGFTAPAVIQDSLTSKPFA